MDEKGHFSITLTPATLFATVAIAALAWLLIYLKDLVLILLTAVVLASAVEPGIQWFMKRKLNRPLSVASIYVLVFLLFFTIAYFFFPPLIAELRAFMLHLPELVRSFDLGTALPVEGDALISSSAIAALLLEFQNLLVPTGESAFSALTGIFGGLFSFLLIIVLSVYFAVQETGVDDFLRIVVPMKHQQYALDLWKRSHYKIGLWMQGQIILSLIIGVLGYLWLSILQVPYAFLIAIFAAVIEIVPVFGSIISGAIATLIGAVAGGPELALLVAGGFLIINLLQSNLIYPLVVKQVVGVPPLLVIIAMIAGGQLAGFFGVLLSVPVAATVQEFISDFQKSRKNKSA